MSTPQDRPSTDSDCASWSPHFAHRLVVAVDWGFKSDHSAIAVAGEYPLLGQKVLAYTRLHRFPLQTPYDVVVSYARDLYDSLRQTGRPVAVVTDSRGSLAQCQALLESGIPPRATIGASLTGSQAHSSRFSVVRLSQQSVLREYSLSRTQLLKDLASAVEGGMMRFPADSDLLLRELAGLRWVRGPSGVERVECPPGGHDDLAVATAMGHWCMRSLPSGATHQPQRRGGGHAAPPVGAWT